MWRTAQQMAALRLVRPRGGDVDDQADRLRDHRTQPAQPQRPPSAHRRNRL